MPYTEWGFNENEHWATSCPEIAQVQEENGACAAFFVRPERLLQTVLSASGPSRLTYL